MKDSATILVRNLVKSFRLTGSRSTLAVLDIPELHVRGGECVAVVGPSGSGKTTLFHLLAGLHTPTHGEVRVNGVSLGALSEKDRDRFRAKNIGYVFQSFNLLGAFTALENVLIAMDLSDVVLPEARRPTARRLLEELGLGDRLHHRSGHLSHGEQQRVAVARALANNPGVILADEPTASVDPETRRIVLDRLLSEARDNGRILMVATHDHSILPGFDSVVSVSQGKAQEITREVHDAGVPANAS